MLFHHIHDNLLD